MKAAVYTESNKPLTIEDVDIIDPRPGEVMVRTAASGVCHSDLHFVDGAWSMPMPCVLNGSLELRLRSRTLSSNNIFE